MRRCGAYFILKSSFAVIIVFLIITGCTYPFASISSKRILPTKVGKTWNPPRRAIKKVHKISSPITIDPSIYDGEISLAETIKFALTNNPNTAISYAQIENSIAQLGLARSDSFPTIEVDSVLTRSRLGYTFPPRILIFQWLTTWMNKAKVTYTLWDFGTRMAKNESALQALFAVGWTYNQEVQNMVKTVTNDYYDNLYQKAMLENEKQNAKDALVILDSAEMKLLKGVGDVTQLVQARTNYLQRQVDVVDQKDKAAASLIQLATDMGMPGNISFTTQNFPCELPGREYLSNLDDLIELTVNNRPSIASRKASVNSKKAAIHQARLDQLPKIDGSVDVSYFQYNAFYKEHLNYTGEFKLSWPFFKGLEYRNRVRQAKAELKKAEAELKKEQEMAFQEVSVSYNNYKNSIDRVEYSTAFLDSALEEFDVTLSNYRAGTGNILDVMQAQTALSDARTKYTVSIRDLFVSLTSLAYSTGSLIAPNEESSWDSIYEFEEFYEN